jgi:histidyl-tRNA synthetase
LPQQIRAVRGMNDILPEQTPIWHYLEQQIQDIVNSYGYRKIEIPVLEATELFQRGVGTGTDIVEKEMYTLADRNGQSMSLRPEATAGTVRAAIQNGMLYNQVQRLWTSGAMFRYERPQKGRYRQFYQTSIEAFGMVGFEIDAEVILLTSRIFKKIGLFDHIKLEMNNLGSTEDRVKYRQALVEYFSKYKNNLDEDSLRRLDINPLRILDSKNSKMQELIANAPVMNDYLAKESLEHFNKLLGYLSEHNIPVVLNNKLVRGLDYYNLTVFEWTTNYLGAQGTICAGGRYDGLVELLGGKPTAAIGCALGLDRIVLILDKIYNLADKLSPYADISIICNNNDANIATWQAEKLRNQLKTIRVHVNYGGSFKSQTNRAENTKAKFIWIIESKDTPDSIKIKCTQTKEISKHANYYDAVQWITKQF